MNALVLEKIEELIGETDCPKHFKCCEAGFQNLCASIDVGQAEYIRCLEDQPDMCRFSIPCGDIHLCRCPIRNYLVKKLKS